MTDLRQGVIARELLIRQDAAHRVDRGVERGACRSLDPFAVPPAVGQRLGCEELHDRRDVSSEPRAVGEGHGIDAHVGFAIPIRQIVVLPPSVLAQLLGRPGQGCGIQSPLAKRREGPGRCGPRLAWSLARIPRRKVGAPSPLAIGILQREQPRGVAFMRHARPRRLPHLFGRTRQIALHLPPQCGVGIQQPLLELVTVHARRVSHAADTRQWVAGAPIGHESRSAHRMRPLP